MNNNLIFKRIGAYLIDFFVITIISMMITRISFINPKYDEYIKVSTEYNEMLTDYYEGKIEVEEFNNKASKISYDMNKSGYVYIISDLVITILYFGIFNYFSKGKTLGKKLMGLQIVSSKDKPLKIYNYLIRYTLLNGFLLQGIIMDIVALIAICFSRGTYYNIYTIGSNINMILQISILVSTMFAPSGRGLHDYVAGTKVINTNIKEAKIEEKETEEIKELKSIKEEVAIIKPKKQNKSNKNKKVNNKDE